MREVFTNYQKIGTIKNYCSGPTEDEIKHSQTAFFDELRTKEKEGWHVINTGISAIEGGTMLWAIVGEPYPKLNTAIEGPTNL